MSSWTAERWAAASGALFAVVLVVSSLITGDPPSYNAGSAEIGEYLTDKHAGITVQTLCGGALIVLFLWFLSSFAGHFRNAGERRMSTVIYGAGVVTITIAAIGDAIAIAATQLLPVLDPGAVQALWGLSFFVYVRLSWALVALTLATAVAIFRTHALPVWFAYVSLVAMVVFAIGGASIRMNGFFSPDGGGFVIALFSAPVWVFIASVLLVAQLGKVAPEPQAAPA